MTQIDMILSCFRVWHSCMGISPDWGGLPDLKKEAWVLAGNRLISWLTGEEPQGADWKKVADGFRINVDSKAVTWSDLDRREQLAWEAVARHLTALVDFQEDDMAGMSTTFFLESTWQEWLEKRLNKEPQNV